MEQNKKVNSIWEFYTELLGVFVEIAPPQKPIQLTGRKVVDTENLRYYIVNGYKVVSGD